MHFPQKLLPCLAAISFLGGCATGSTASFTQAPLFFSEEVAESGDFLDTSETTARETLAGGSFEASPPGFITMAGNAALPVRMLAASQTGAAGLTALAVDPRFDASLGRDSASLSPQLNVAATPVGTVSTSATGVINPTSGIAAASQLILTAPLGVAAGTGVGAGAGPAGIALSPSVAVNTPIANGGLAAPASLGSGATGVVPTVNLSTPTLGAGAAISTASGVLANGPTASGSPTGLGAALLNSATNSVRQSCVLTKC